MNLIILSFDLLLCQKTGCDVSTLIHFERIYDLVSVRITVVQDKRALKLHVTHSQPDIIVICS